uniref:hypothetical protein n=1 Tax=Herbidospora sakaeratensis TaxID=564415 RepID=UPI0012F8AAE2|nr:hypothetical protein [Herbidospora sakaeratensis]
MPRYVVIAVVALLVAGCGPETKTAAEIGAYVEAYLRAHPDVERAATNGTARATMITEGPDQDVFADLGGGLRGRLIRADGVAYMRMGDEETAPGRPVRQRLSARTATEIVYSDWDDTTVTAPPADQIRS